MNILTDVILINIEQVRVVQSVHLFEFIQYSKYIVIYGLQQGYWAALGIKMCPNPNRLTRNWKTGIDRL